VREVGFDAERIDIQVQDEVAILTGNVRSEAEGRNAADAVLRKPAVQRVSNEMMVRRKARYFLPMRMAMSPDRGFPRAEQRARA
jgi:hypothetical protein